MYQHKKEPDYYARLLRDLVAKGKKVPAGSVVEVYDADDPVRVLGYWGEVNEHFWIRREFMERV